MPICSIPFMNLYCENYYNLTYIIIFKDGYTTFITCRLFNSRSYAIIIGIIIALVYKWASSSVTLYSKNHLKVSYLYIYTFMDMRALLKSVWNKWKKQRRGIDKAVLA